MSHCLFIDDSGSKDWINPYTNDFVFNPPERNQQNLTYWRNNYFVLAGTYISKEAMAKLNPLINAKKREVFGTSKVELHSADLRNKIARKKKYLDKYGITAETLKEFVEEFWYPLFDCGEMQLVAIVVDKRYFESEARTKSPLEIAAEALFDHTELHPYGECKIIFDQMDEKIGSRTNNQGKILKIADTKIDLDDGKFENKYHNTGVVFEESLNSNFLQFADMIAYNVARQFIDYGDEWDKHSAEGEHRMLPTYSYFERISRHFYHDEKNRVSGYGIIKVPDPYNTGNKGWNLD